MDESGNLIGLTAEESFPMSVHTFSFVSVIAKMVNCVWSFSRNPRELKNVEAGAPAMATILEAAGWRDNASIAAVKMPREMAQELLHSRMGHPLVDLETTGYFESDDKGQVYLCTTGHTRKRALDIIRGRNPARFAELFKTLPLMVYSIPLPEGEADMKRFEKDLQTIYQDEMAADPSKRPLDRVERHNQIMSYLELGWTEKEVASRIFGSISADEEKNASRSPIQMAKRIDALAKVLPDFFEKWVASARGVKDTVAITDDLIKGVKDKVTGLHQMLVAEKEEIGVSRFGPDNCPKLKLRWEEIKSGAGKPKAEKKMATAADIGKMLEAAPNSDVKLLLGDLSGDPKVTVNPEERKKILTSAAEKEGFAKEYPELFAAYRNNGGKRVDPVTVYPDGRVAGLEEQVKLLTDELEAVKNAAPKTAGAKKHAPAGK